MVLVLVQPLVAVIGEQLVLSKRRVDKTIHKGRCQVHTSRVHLRAAASKPCHTQHRHQYFNTENHFQQALIKINTNPKACRLTVVFQMCLVDVIWDFGLHDIQLGTERDLSIQIKSWQTTSYVKTATANPKHVFGFSPSAVRSKTGHHHLVSFSIRIIISVTIHIRANRFNYKSWWPNLILDESSKTFSFSKKKHKWHFN